MHIRLAYVKSEHRIWFHDRHLSGPAAFRMQTQLSSVIAALLHTSGAFVVAPGAVFVAHNACRSFKGKRKLLFCKFDTKSTGRPKTWSLICSFCFALSYPLDKTHFEKARIFCFSGQVQFSMFPCQTGLSGVRSDVSAGKTASWIILACLPTRQQHAKG